MSNSKRKLQSSNESRKKKNRKTSELTMNKPLTIVVSSCALFRQETGEIYPTGVAFPLVKALKMVNQRLTELKQPIEEQFKIVLIPTSSQDMDRLKSSIASYNLNVDIACEKKPLIEHLDEIKPVLYLSTNTECERRHQSRIWSSNYVPERLP
ncbi:hypothetical protein G5714_013576 [Onychostoma macrolepis]|uniref:Uncharacterized protein n=1 Tax=Onychostoma macrolepis TaxID=369639 RepID=A0A7J6CFQ2_9TELE|nr:hypothetical protein G5714_013576 [Onychostoma macrolepis]